MRTFVRRDLYAALFAIGTLLILALVYIPIVRVHQGWEDEIYFASTCLSMLRGTGPTPSALADFPSPQSPLHFYGPTLFWLETLVLEIFGFSIRTWRSFTFAGEVAFLAMLSVLFYRLRGSWAIAMGAVLVFSLAPSLSFGFSLPGRPDAWTLALIVLAIVLVAKQNEEEERIGRYTGRWIGFGALSGLAASTTPRSWPLLFLMFLMLPLLVPARRLWTMGIVAVSASAVFSLVLIPLRTSIWGTISFVRQASKGDAVDVTPLMGGRWSFGHASTQLMYYGALLIILCLVYFLHWLETPRFQRWLLTVALLNLAVNLLLTARALNMTVYWGFLLEIAALSAITESGPRGRIRAVRWIAAALLVFMVTLRVARELPVLTHWQQRDPRGTEQAMRAVIPRGSLVYGPKGDFFFPAIAMGADYRHPVDWASPGRTSTPGRPGSPAPMIEACHTPAYLVWRSGKGGEQLPPMPHATLQRVADHSETPEHTGFFERMVEKVPGGRSEPDHDGFTIYRLQLNAQYCAEVAP